MMLRTCLITGIITASVISCTKTDYVNESEWYYINNTNKTIQITYGDGSYISDDMNFVLCPNEVYSFVISSASTKPNLTAEDYNSPYSLRGATISIDGIGEQFFPGQDCSDFKGILQSICNINNYISIKYSTNHYKFTYEFNDGSL